MSAIDYDYVHWDEVGTALVPLATPKAFNYPAVGDVALGVVFGADSEYTGTANLFDARPTQPSLRIIDNSDGTATATISGSDTGTTNYVYVFLRHGGVLELVVAGSRTGDGDVSLSGLSGEYIGYAISSINNILSVPSDPDGFWVTNGNQYLIRTAAAEAELQSIKLSQYGTQVVFTNGENASPVTIYAIIERGSETISLRRGGQTDTQDLIFHAPRQTGFPPAGFKTGATITYDSKIYEIDTIEPSNGTLEFSSSFRLSVGIFREGGNY